MLGMCGWSCQPVPGRHFLLGVRIPLAGLSTGRLPGGDREVCSFAMPRDVGRRGGPGTDMGSGSTNGFRPIYDPGKATYDRTTVPPKATPPGSGSLMAIARVAQKLWSAVRLAPIPSTVSMPVASTVTVKARRAPAKNVK